jgi:hypothetical protein
MRLTRVLCCLMILGISAVAAYAQTPVDPTARINSGFDPACGSGGVLCLIDYLPNAFGTLKGSAELSVPFSSSLHVLFSFDDAAHNVNHGAILKELFLQYTGVPDGTSVSCESDIWKDCGQVTGQPSGIVLFFFKNPGFCLDGGSVLLSCPGFMTYQEGANVTNLPDVSAVPEPSSIVLFGTGVILLFVGTKRRIHVRT